MQSGYGGVSEIQQFMVDGCPPSLFSISTSPPPPPPNANSPSDIHAAQKFHPLSHPHHHHQQQQLPPPPPQQHFAHFGHPIPITQQLFHQPHQFQLFQHHQYHQHQQQQHLGLDQESGPENSNSQGGPSFLAAMNFKLGVNESGDGGSRDEDDGILQGGDDGSESRLQHHHHHHHHPWHRDEDHSAAAAANIKQPFWRPLDIDFINPNNKRQAKDKQPAEISSNVKHFKKSNEVLDHNQNNNHHHQATATDSNYKLFSELEAIYKPGGTPSGGGATNNQTGSGSALTGDDNPLMPASAPGPAVENQPDNISNTSNAEVPPPLLPPDKYQKGASSSGGRRKLRKRKQHQKQLASIATFFESLVKQLMDHQEGLHRNFLEVMERRDQERTNREESWRKQEAARANREAAARAQERALAATREAAIISFIEKFTGESLNLPSKPQFQSQFTEESQKEQEDNNALELYNADSANNNNSLGIQLSSSRWPKVEVQALIRVRSGFETRFQEPGLKSPLWEEVSLAMAAMGYNRSAKRCKEKWENINKYFRKTKDSGKKRPQHSKTCPYFHQLDQLYSKSSTNANVNEETRKDRNSELLDAIVVSNEAAGKRKSEFDGAKYSADDQEEDGDEEEGQGESQEQAQDCEN